MNRLRLIITGVIAVVGMLCLTALTMKGLEDTESYHLIVIFTLIAMLKTTLSGLRGKTKREGSQVKAERKESV